MENPNLFIITGGPGAGKTTVLIELKRRGFPFVGEVARQIIQEQVAAGGAALPWADTSLYTRLMLERSIASFQQHAQASGPLFCDRGLPDTLAYARLIGLADEKPIREACTQYRYARRVFIAPPWLEIYRVDNERKQSWDEAQRTFDQLFAAYRDCGYELIELPRLSPADRAQFILDVAGIGPQ